MKRNLSYIILIVMVISCTMEVPVQPKAKLVANKTTCQAPCEVTFTSESTNALTQEWDFDDGSAVYRGSSPPVHRFEIPAQYDVKLLVTGTDGGSSGATLRINVEAKPGDPPSAKFDYTVEGDATAPAKVNFTDQSSANSVKREWNFGDEHESTADNPNISGEEKPSHIYKADGSYTVTLITSDASGKKSIPFPKTIVIKKPALAASFDVSNNDCVAKCTVEFTNTSTNEETWTWDFGDGNTSIEESPKHTYEKSGTYTVRLTVKRGTDTETTTQTVTIKSPSVSFKALMISGPASWGRDIITDANGNFYVCGQAIGTADFGNGLVLSSDGKSDFFIAKYDRNGKCLWAKMGGSAGEGFDEAFKVVLDDRNDVYIAGTVSGQVTSATFPGVIPYGGYDAFVAKLSGSNGNIIWFKTLGGASTDRAEGLAFSPSNQQIYLAANMKGNNLTFSPTRGKVSADDSGDIFFIYIDPSDGSISGDPSRISGSGEQTVKSLVTDNKGNAYIAGYFKEELNFGANPAAARTTEGNTDAFLAKWQGDRGEWIWSAHVGSNGEDQGNYVIVDKSENVYMMGSHTGYVSSFEFGSSSNRDIFVGKWNSNGSLIQGKYGFSSGADSPGGLGLAPDGRVLIFGSFQSEGRFPASSNNVVHANGQLSDLVFADFDGTFTKAVGGTGGESPGAVSVSPDGIIYATGSFLGEIKVDDVTLNSNSAADPKAYIIAVKP